MIKVISGDKLFYTIDTIIRSNFTEEMKIVWRVNGYDGLTKIVPKHFNFDKLYRGKMGKVTYEFTQEQLTMFLLKYG